MTSLQGFYLIGAIILVAVALVYWADAIRSTRGRVHRASRK